MILKVKLQLKNLQRKKPVLKKFKALEFFQDWLLSLRLVFTELTPTLCRITFDSSITARVGVAFSISMGSNDMICFILLSTQVIFYFQLPSLYK